MAAHLFVYNIMLLYCTVYEINITKLCTFKPWAAVVKSWFIKKLNAVASPDFIEMKI